MFCIWKLVAIIIIIHVLCLTWDTGVEGRACFTALFAGILTVTFAGMYGRTPVDSNYISTYRFYKNNKLIILNINSYFALLSKL